ncbi:hypothetical protein AAT19DRAFT_16696 [Rhodotorula toruloides]|uniref:Uncharacterized protein n=1 Tax=Rhodotorula toruloides TaxID=5286 RepID=A0A2T0A427_RHOTO|nr:hypothetical protein AAT19DRAFT_16696 [Rhodotorula toruloides]
MLCGRIEGRAGCRGERSLQARMTSPGWPRPSSCSPQAGDRTGCLPPACVRQSLQQWRYWTPRPVPVGLTRAHPARPATLQARGSLPPCCCCCIPSRAWQALRRDLRMTSNPLDKREPGRSEQARQREVLRRRSGGRRESEESSREAAAPCRRGTVHKRLGRSIIGTSAAVRR